MSKSNFLLFIAFRIPKRNEIDDKGHWRMFGGAVNQYEDCFYCYTNEREFILVHGNKWSPVGHQKKNI